MRFQKINIPIIKIHPYYTTRLACTIKCLFLVHCKYLQYELKLDLTMKIPNLVRVSLIAIIFSFFSPTYLIGQNLMSKYFQSYYGFGKSLYNENDYKRAIGQLKIALNFNELAGFNKADSINYLIGVSYSKVADYGLSSRYLAHVSKHNTILYEKVVFQSSKNYILINEYDSAVLYCQSFTNGLLSKKYSDNLTLMLASSYLLLNNTESASRVLNKANLSGSKLFDYSTELENFKPKSPFLAGTLSAIVPGTGKFYTKNIGHGLMSLFVNGLLAYRTVIEYNRGGINSTGFIIFGTLFLITYITNIVGSVISAKQYNQRHYNEVHSKVIDFVNEFD